MPTARRMCSACGACETHGEVNHEDGCPNEKPEQLEILLRHWLDDDEAVDLAGMVVEEPESVMTLLYDGWPTRHGGDDADA